MGTLPSPPPPPTRGQSCRTPASSESIEASGPDGHPAWLLKLPVTSKTAALCSEEKGPLFLMAQHAQLPLPLFCRDRWPLWTRGMRKGGRTGLAAFYDSFPLLHSSQRSPQPAGPVWSLKRTQVPCLDANKYSDTSGVDRVCNVTIAPPSCFMGVNGSGLITDVSHRRLTRGHRQSCGLERDSLGRVKRLTHFSM